MSLLYNYNTWYTLVDNDDKKTEKSPMYYRVVILFLSHLFFSRREFFVFFVLAVLETIVDVAKQKSRKRRHPILLFKQTSRNILTCFVGHRKTKTKTKTASIIANAM